MAELSQREKPSDWGAIDLMNAGETFAHRCQVIASILEVPESEMVAYVGSIIHKAPGPNHQSNRQDLEQSIWVRLLRQQRTLKGSWTLVKLSASFAARTWWEDFLAERDISVQRSLSLDREYARANMDEESMPFQIPDDTDEIGAADSEMDSAVLLKAIPEPIRKLISMRLNGAALTVRERVQLHRWVATNGEAVKSYTEGTAPLPAAWVKPANGKKLVVTLS